MDPKRCEREVRALHEFIEAWFGGRIEATDGSFRRPQDAFGPEFKLISVSGGVQPRDELLDTMWSRHGSHGDEEPAFKISIKAFEPRYVFDDACLVRYEEHMRIEGEWTRRTASAVFGPGDGPNGVVWVHLQETMRSD